MSGIQNKKHHHACRVCQICGKKYTPTGGRQRYCGADCKEERISMLERLLRLTAGYNKETPMPDIIEDILRHHEQNKP